VPNRHDWAELPSKADKKRTAKNGAWGILSPVELAKNKPATRAGRSKHNSKRKFHSPREIPTAICIKSLHPGSIQSRFILRRKHLLEPPRCFFFVVKFGSLQYEIDPLQGVRGTISGGEKARYSTVVGREGTTSSVTV
jgi:hypothetical protein